MPVLHFRGEHGQRVWNNIKDHLHLVNDLPNPRSDRSSAGREAEVRMVTFMVAVSFGLHRIKDPRYSSRLERFRFLSRHNPLIYKITYSRSETVLLIDSGSGTQRLSLGHACGFSAILPLTKLGYDCYMKGSLAAHELGEPHIMPLEPSRRATEHLMIAGASHLPSLLKKKVFDDPDTLSRTAYAVIANLLRQLAAYSPRLAIAEDSGDSVYRRGDPHRSLPVVTCFISGVGRGELLLRRAGFVWEGEDKVGNRRYVLRFGSGGHLGKVALVKRIIHYQNHP